MVSRGGRLEVTAKKKVPKGWDSRENHITPVSNKSKLPRVKCSLSEPESKSPLAAAVLARRAINLLVRANPMKRVDFRASSSGIIAVCV